MKFYDCGPAPSPRRVRIFIAEKGLEIPTVQVDLIKGEQFTEEFKALNPECTVPVLELDDGTGLSESVAICRYLEELHPEPPLMGVEPKEKAIVEMWNRRIEQYGFWAVSESFRNFVRAFKGHALTGAVGFEQLPELVERGRARAAAFFEELDARLAKSHYVAGDTFTIADITGLVTVDFAKRIKMQVTERHANIKRWHDEVSERPSAKL